MEDQANIKVEIQKLRVKLEKAGPEELKQMTGGIVKLINVVKGIANEV